MIGRGEQVDDLHTLPPAAIHGPLDLRDLGGAGEVDPDGHRGNDISGPVAIIPGGRLAIFSSRATDLTPNDRTGAWSLFTA